MKIRCYACEQKLDVSDIEPFAMVACPNCETQIIVPKLFGELLFEEQIGRGTVATVYRAMDMTLDRENAVKVLHGSYAMDAQMSDQFLQAARHTSHWTHPHVIPIYSCGKVGEEPYIVMQYMAGGSLHDRLSAAGQDPLPIDQLCDWFYQVVLGLEGAARQETLHHDLKPSNILFDLDDNVKVGDFGLAVIAFPEEPIDLGVKDCHVPLVRSWYLAPEVISRGKHSKLSDIYQLGAVMYHALTGRPPFNDEDARYNLQARFREAPAPVIKLRQDVPAELGQLVQSMLCAYPEDRPTSYDEIASRIKPFRRETSASFDTAEHPSAADAEPPTPKRTFKVPPSLKENGQRDVSVAASRQPDPTPKAGLFIWAIRIVFALLALALMGMIAGHVMQAEWYETLVRPHLPIGGQSVPSE